MAASAPSDVVIIMASYGTVLRQGGRKISYISSHLREKSFLKANPPCGIYILLGEVDDPQMLICGSDKRGEGNATRLYKKQV